MTPTIVKPKLLVLSDSPTLQTGFARVARNLLPHWAAHFEIDVWAVGYQGWPHELPYRLFPASSLTDGEWQSDGNLERFLTMLAGGGYTHLWMMQDLFHVCRFATALKEICAKGKIRSLLYYPVDAPVSAHWVRAVLAVDVAVAYTAYGYGEIKKHPEAGHLKKRILPHGTDITIYRPTPDGRRKGREMFTVGKKGGSIKDDDFLIVAVSAHQKRKGLAQTLQVFQQLLQFAGDGHGRLRLYLHMPPSNPAEGSDLKLLVHEMGLGQDVLFADGAFSGNASRLTELHMPMIYQAADLLLTTTLGEGWGLPLTEAMACGTPVAGPSHTAVAELLGATAPTGLLSEQVPWEESKPSEERGVLFGCNATIVLPNDNMRPRPVTSAHDASEAILAAMDAHPEQPHSLAAMAARALEWTNRPEFRWETIAAQWLELMEV